MNPEVVFRNGEAVPLRSIPALDISTFRNELISATARNGQRIAALFGQRLSPERARLYALLADDNKHLLRPLLSEVEATYHALTPDCTQAHLFEREIFEQVGVHPEGHPWLKPLRLGHTPEGGRPHPFFSMAGEEVHEVAVGPVHAGVIEPGHFRFQCHGEVVDHLEIHLGYQHRGAEEALAGGPHRRTMVQMETIAGDTTIAYATAYCQVMEALGAVQAPPRAQALRAIALELERLANHVGDMGALANDVGFLPTAAFCGRLRGDFLNMTALVCGSRFGRGLVRPGGVAFDIDNGMAKDLLQRLTAAERDVASAIKLFFSTRSVIERLAGAGHVSREACLDLGIVGLAARASGLARDTRADHPWGLYRTAPLPVSTWPTGDVYARAKVRHLEIQHSIAFLREQLERLPGGPFRQACPPPAPEMLTASLVEGWRGEVLHVAITDSQGHFARYKLKDPSFHNWAALALALRGQQISDFPLCNKSFNLSYCGFDL